ncbi:hypothetical protein HZP56_08615 [Elizabethkingia anophelis]|nr:hypothetical protein [Elizabethkingia anophelis]MCT4176841.1 hypothetical protein [Elizabethkingia anophelis]
MKNKIYKLNSFCDLKKIKNKIDLKSKITKDKGFFLNNYFKKVKLEDEESSFKSYFTDLHVIKILQKVSNRKVKNLVNEFIKIKNEETDRSLQLRFILHSICSKLKDKFGAKMLSFIHDLPILDRPKEQFEILKGIHDIDISENYDIESYTIIKDHKKIFIGFEKLEYDNKPYMIVCDRNGHLQVRINEKGFIEDDFINRLRFNLFDMLKDGKFSYVGAILNCECSICHRELTVPESIYFGMGPICREHYYH